MNEPTPALSNPSDLSTEPARGACSRLYTSTPARANGHGARPSIAFLVLLNGLIFFALGAIGTHRFGILFHIPITLFFMILSLIPQGIVRLAVERRFYLKPGPRFVAYLSPLWLLVLAGLVLPAAARPPNKQNPTRSPDGHYEARFSSPDGGWKIVITDRQSKAKWKEETPFLSHLQIYWHWDANNRLWIYNSDDGRVHYLETANEGWRLHEWNGNLGRKNNTEVIPPPPYDLYPPYAAPSR